jgi:hypothetical protein
MIDFQSQMQTSDRRWKLFNVKFEEFNFWRLGNSAPKTFGLKVNRISKLTWEKREPPWRITRTKNKRSIFILNSCRSYVLLAFTCSTPDVAVVTLDMFKPLIIDVQNNLHLNEERRVVFVYESHFLSSNRTAIFLISYALENNPLNFRWNDI